MDNLEKKILKTACNNLRRATTIPARFNTASDYMEWIRTANRAAMDIVNIVDTLMGEDSTKTNETITL